ncbi:MAG: hypothetical protein LIR50_17555 [Bacillota bacterium]|nr:hypothetical protein [Bacillota bacterium]
MNRTSNNNYLRSLKKKAIKLIAKCEDSGYEFTELECAAISNIGKAKKYNDINWLAIDLFIKLCERWNNK